MTAPLRPGSPAALPAAEADALQRLGRGATPPAATAPVIGPREALGFSHRSGVLLAGSLDYDETLRQIAQLVVPDVADWCGIYVERVDGPAQEFTSVHPDAEVEAALLDIRRRRRRQGAGSESLEVMRSRRPVLVPEVAGLPADVPEEQRPLLERLGPRSYIIVPLVVRDRAIGALTLLSTRPGRHYTPDDLLFAETLASRFALAIDNARLYDAAEQSLGLVETVFATAPVGLAFVDRELRYVRVNDTLAAINGRPVEEHLGRSVMEILGEMAEHVVGHYEHVLATGAPVLDAEISGQTPARPAQTRHWNVSYAPVRGLDGELIGVSIVVVDITERRELLDREREARLRADFLARAGVLLDASLDYEQTLTNVAEVTVPGVADWCGVSVLDDGGVLREVAVAHVDPAKRALAQEISERWPVDPDAPTGTPNVARTGVTEFVREITDEMLVAGIPDPEQLDLVRRLALRSIIIAPLTARGRTFGTLTLANGESSRLFDDDDVQLAEELARRAGIAIDNARLYTERTRIAHTLQVRLLPERLPRIAGARLAARYRAAGELNEVGGDFYDVFPRSATEWALVVGDVSGKGAEAASLTALARYTLRAAALEPGPPSQALGRLNAAMLAHDETSQFATAVLAYVTPDEGGGMRVTLALGGHPPPIVLGAGGAVATPGAFGGLLGCWTEAAFADTSVSLAPGDTLLLYTDGVTEAGVRGRPLGQGGLVDVARELVGRTPEEVVDAVERAVVAAQPGAPRDDIALLAISVAAER